MSVSHSKIGRRQEESRTRRLALFDKVTELKRNGWSISGAPLKPGLDRKTIRSCFDNEVSGSWARKSPATASGRCARSLFELALVGGLPQCHAALPRHLPQRISGAGESLPPIGKEKDCVSP